MINDFINQLTHDVAAWVHERQGKRTDLTSSAPEIGIRDENKRDFRLMAWAHSQGYFKDILQEYRGKALTAAVEPPPGPAFA